MTVTESFAKPQEEPEWIRRQSTVLELTCDNDAAAIGRSLYAICGTETTYCEICGHESLLWPCYEWADHIRTVHADFLTLEAKDNYSQMCEPELNQAQTMFFWIQFAMRVSMRRRAWLFDQVRPVASESRVHLPS